MESKKITCSLFWWTERNLIPVTGCTKEASRLEVIDPNMLSLKWGAKILKIIVGECLQLSAGAEIFIVSNECPVLIADDASFQDILSGKYGEVSTLKPLRILIAGDWTLNSNKASVSFNQWLRQIYLLCFVPPLPPVSEHRSTNTIDMSFPPWIRRDCAPAITKFLQTRFTNSFITEIPPKPELCSHVEKPPLECYDSPPPYESIAISTSSFHCSRSRRGLFSRLAAFISL